MQRGMVCSHREPRDDWHDDHMYFGCKLSVATQLHCYNIVDLTTAWCRRSALATSLVIAAKSLRIVSFPSGDNDWKYAVDLFRCSGVIRFQFCSSTRTPCHIRLILALKAIQHSQCEVRVRLRPGQVNFHMIVSHCQRICDLSYKYFHGTIFNIYIQIKIFHDIIFKKMSWNFLFCAKYFSIVSFWHGIRWQTTWNDSPHFYFAQNIFQNLSFFPV